MNYQKFLTQAPFTAFLPEPPVNLDATSPMRIGGAVISAGALRFSGESPVMADAAASSRNANRSEVGFSPFKVPMANFAGENVGTGLVMGNMVLGEWLSSHVYILALSNGRGNK